MIRFVLKRATKIQILKYCRSYPKTYKSVFDTSFRSRRIFFNSALSGGFLSYTLEIKYCSAGPFGRLEHIFFVQSKVERHFYLQAVKIVEN